MKDILDVIKADFLIYLANELEVDIQNELEPLRNYDGENELILKMKNKYCKEDSK